MPHQILAQNELAGSGRGTHDAPPDPSANSAEHFDGCDHRGSQQRIYCEASLNRPPLRERVFPVSAVGDAEDHDLLRARLFQKQQRRPPRRLSFVERVIARASRPCKHGATDSRYQHRTFAATPLVKGPVLRRFAPIQARAYDASFSRVSSLRKVRTESLQLWKQSFRRNENATGLARALSARSHAATPGPLSSG